MSEPAEYSQSFKDGLKALNKKCGFDQQPEFVETLFEHFVPRKDFDGVEALRRELHERCKQLEIMLEKAREHH